MRDHITCRIKKSSPERPARAAKKGTEKSLPVRGGRKTGVLAALSAAFVESFVEPGQKNDDFDEGGDKGGRQSWVLGEALSRHKAIAPMSQLPAMQAA